MIAFFVTVGILAVIAIALGVLLAICYWLDDKWKTIKNFYGSRELDAELKILKTKNADLERKVVELETRLGYR